MADEREKFAQRLVHAMQQAGYEPRPIVLFHLFNAKYRGASVTFQTVSRWLRGRAMPEQDKLQVMADLLGIEPHALRFGVSPRSRVAEARPPWPAGAGSRERQVVEAFLQLPPKKRELVGELVKALSDSA